MTEVHFDVGPEEVVKETIVPELDQVISFLVNNTEISEETVGVIEILRDQLGEEDV